VAAHYNVNRNNFQGSLPLRQDLTVDTVSGTAPNQVVNSTPRTVGSGSANRFPVGDEEARYTIPLCQTNQVARAGVADLANSCGSTFDERYNPSKTGNIRGSSRFTLSDQLVFTFDPSYQWVQANGGGTVVAQEGLRDVDPTGGTANCNTTPSGAGVSCQYGYIAGTPYFGRDLNGDGDLLDTVRMLAPSQTGTRRIGVITGLRYEMSDTQTVRLNYTYDRARHRQTGEVGILLPNGKPQYVFPITDPLTDVGGNVLQKRDRLSYAILHQVSAEYRGEFFDEKLVLRAGVAMKFMKRNLTNYCATSSAAGFVECYGTNDAGLAAYLAANPTVNAIPGQPAQATQGPQQRILNYKKATPDVGITFKFTPQASIFANYSQGIQVPGTDNLYNSFFFSFDTAQARPKPEKTDNFDVGFRYSSSKIQAQIGAWYTDYHDRLASSYDPDLEKSIYRNLGRVKKYGFDGSVSYRPIHEFSLYGFGSYLHSEIQDDVVVGRTSGGTAIYAPTAGKREAGAPVYTFGGGATLDLAFFSLGVNAKRTGPRYIYDTNEPVRQQLTVNGSPVVKEIFGAKAPAYTLVDFNARVGLDWAGLNDQTYFQFNLLNAFNEKYVGGFTANLNQGPTYNATTGAITNYGSAPNAQLGYPRTFMGSVVVGF
ncbi:TonB-dependent receptor domain-containing protein, partial [Sphingomonas sp.]|uniref:TonB-dependent receptor domain-containing protein n=1 Tax=Sphingomonas sp. TaxID=28214 RepID=UPI002B84C17A